MAVLFYLFRPQKRAFLGMAGAGLCKVGGNFDLSFRLNTFAL